MMIMIKISRQALLLLTISCLVLSFLVLGGCSLAKLQAGLETPSPAMLTASDTQLKNKSPSKPISDYYRFLVSSTDNIEIAVHARENKDAIANVFFIHGAGGGAWAWEIFFQHMPEDYNLYALSWRGHFDSSPVENARMEDYVADQQAVLRAIAARNNLPVHLVGHSYGGAAAILQVAETQHPVASITLLAPVVPLDYDLAQRLLVPLVAPVFIKQENDADGVFGGMFLSQSQMRHYFDAYASKPFSIEKTGLIAGDGISPQWQKKLAHAYATVSKRNIPMSLYLARYDNVVVPRRQQQSAAQNDIPVRIVESGHYIPLDVVAEEVATMIAAELRSGM